VASMESGVPAVDVADLSFSYGDREVVKGLSIQVGRGTIYGLLGANGSGKTTFIRVLVGLMKPGSGSVKVLGEDPSPKLTEHVGYMPQLNALYQELTVRNNVDFFARMYGMNDRRKRKTAVDEAISVVGLSDRAGDGIQSLSGGMRQRVSLAIALVHSPSLLLLDEPTVGLDPELRAAFWDHFRQLASAGTTILISSHTMDDAAHCDRLAFLQTGKIIAQDSPAELRKATGQPDSTLEDAFLYFVRKGRDNVLA
jgi:ABC-2 type transport system ATP-binding protein